MDERSSRLPLEEKTGCSLGSDQGGKSLAILSNFIATYQQFRINPWTYLRDTLTKLPTTPEDQLHTLLPIK